MHRISRRECLAAVGVAAGVGLAGCLSNDDGSDDGANGGDDMENGSDDGANGEDDMDDGGDDGANGEDDMENGDDGDPTVSVTGPVDGEVTSNAIQELVVVGLESQVSNVFSVTVTLENLGDERTSAMDYTYTLALFDDADEELDRVVGNKANLGAGMGPGQQGTVIVTPQFYEGGPEDVARYELTVDCTGREGDERGVYCP